VFIILKVPKHNTPLSTPNEPEGSNWQVRFTRPGRAGERPRKVEDSDRRVKAFVLKL